MSNMISSMLSYNLLDPKQRAQTIVDLKKQLGKDRRQMWKMWASQFQTDFSPSIMSDDSEDDIEYLPDENILNQLDSMLTRMTLRDPSTWFGPFILSTTSEIQAMITFLQTFDTRCARFNPNLLKDISLFHRQYKELLDLATMFPNCNSKPTFSSTNGGEKAEQQQQQPDQLQKIKDFLDDSELSIEQVTNSIKQLEMQSTQKQSVQH